MPTVFSEVFSLDYEAAPNLLVGRWLTNVPDHTLHPPQQELLSAALQNSRCRFWLLDMRTQNEFSLALLDWLKELLAEQVVMVLGSPVFLACVASESHRDEIDSIGTETLLRQQAQHEFYPYFFNNEEAAREWLAESQSHEHSPPRR
ncbi:hypothetical protein [Hymenobacter sp. B1770]|uniref:hypothetical protein n=1 Tax=Hymenobacter sp. B1770 TaxID=1718788 RepID=UPI003CF8F0D2